MKGLDNTRARSLGASTPGLAALVGGMQRCRPGDLALSTAVGSGQNFVQTAVQTAVDPPSSAAPGRTIAPQESLDSSPTVPEDTVTLSGFLPCRKT